MSEQRILPTVNRDGKLEPIRIVTARQAEQDEFDRGFWCGVVSTAATVSLAIAVGLAVWYAVAT